MRTETWVFSAGAVFFVPLAFLYGILTQFGEPVGFASILLTGLLAGMVGLYLALVRRNIDPRPEDDPRAEIADGAGEMGFFNPRSVWPILMAFGAASLFAGLAVGPWLFLIGGTIFLFTTLGLVFEHYRGQWQR
jgi:hypothetical protein